MSVKTTSYERQGFYSLKQFGDVATLKLGRNILLNAIDLALKNSLFLCKMLGYCQAKQLLMSDKIFNAPEALEMGIVDQVVPYSKLEEEARKIAQDFTKRSKRSLEGIKKLINYNIKDLQDYLEFESFELLKTTGV